MLIYLILNCVGSFVCVYVNLMKAECAGFFLLVLYLIALINPLVAHHLMCNWFKVF